MVNGWGPTIASSGKCGRCDVNLAIFGKEIIRYEIQALKITSSDWTNSIEEFYWLLFFKTDRAFTFCCCSPKWSQLMTIIIIWILFKWRCRTVFFVVVVDIPLKLKGNSRLIFFNLFSSSFRTFSIALYLSCKHMPCHVLNTQIILS